MIQGWMHVNALPSQNWSELYMDCMQSTVHCSTVIPYKILHIKLGFIPRFKPSWSQHPPSDNQTYNTAPLNTVKSILKLQIF